MTVRKYTSRSQQTTLTSAVTSGGTTINVSNASSLLGNVAGADITGGATFTVVLDPDTALEEIVDVTGVSSNTLTIVRSIDATGTATDHSAGAVVRHMIIGRDLRESNTHIEATGTVHGLLATSGVVVGTAATQTLTNKTLTTPIVAGATISGAITSTATITGGTLTGAIVTGLTSSGLGDTQATPKNYVDAILGSATAAATSAASAATSATAAATSASSAATSASSAATSASSSLTSQTAAATSATSAAASATAAATSATSAATQATAATTSATSAAASATAAATSATSAAVSATAAATSATSSATSAAAALTSANSAATSAASSAASTSAAATSATAAATSATSAAASATAAATSATSAAASATAASTSASSALTSQTAAATSATSAAASATAAATSATSAAASASAAATTYDDFDDRYLGAKSTAPSVDNDGNALLTGAFYWNSTSNLMFVWSGSAWVQITTTSSYSAPTLGSTTIASGTTYSTVVGLTLNAGLATADPTLALGLATKQYVDAVTTGINFHTPVVAASTSNLGVTYNNGSSGVGATLTADTLRAFNTLDGQSVSVGGRVLIKDQTTQLQNGIYTLTNNGSAGVTAWVLTRATDNDNNPAGEMSNGDIVNTSGGTVNAGKTFVNSTTGTITIGTTAITFATYYAGLPEQTGNANKYLGTDGTTPSWRNVITDPTASIFMLMGA